MNEGLAIKLRVDSAQAVQGLREVQQAVQATASAMRSSFAAIAGPIGIAVAAATASAAAVAKMVSTSIQGADAIGKLAQEAGIATREFSQLAFATQFSDVSADDLAVTFKFLSGKMQDALSGGKEATAIFQRLGVAFENVDGSLRGPDAVFRDIVESMSKMSDGAEKTALAVDLFGRAGQKLIPIINDGVEGLDDWAQKAREAGAVISGDLAKQADDFGDSMQLLREQFKGIFITMAQELLPTLNQLARSIQDVLRSVGGMGTVLEEVRQFTSVMVSFANVGVTAFVTVGKVFDGIVDGIVENFRILRDTVAGGLDFLGVAAVAQMNLIRDAVTQGPLEALRTFRDTMRDATTGAIDAASAGIKSRKDGFIAQWRGITSEIAAMWKDAVGGVINPFGSGSSPFGSSGSKDNPVLNTPGKLDKDTTETLRRINDEYAKATMSRLELLDYEREQQLLKLREQLKDEEEFQGAKLGIERVYAKRRRDIIEDQRRAQADVELAAVRGRTSGISGDKDITQAEKKAQLLPLLEQENQLVSQQLAIYQTRSQDGSLSDEQRIEAARRINELEQERVRILQQTRDLQADTFGGTFRRGMIEMFDDFSNVGRNLANGALRTVRSAVDGISDGIMGAIDGTVKWGQIGARIFKQMLADLIKIGVQAIFVKAITSFIPGAGSFLGIGARASGGPVTKGLYQLGEEGPEFVLNNRATSKIGLPALQEINKGRIPVLAPPPGQHSGGGSPGNLKIAVGVVDKRSDYESWVESNHFERAVMTVVQRNRR